jgi:N-acyl-phosphatidylethanolamine-hydrolysing phospholipase D
MPLAPPPSDSPLRAPHYDGHRFFTPWEPFPHSHLDLLRRRLQRLFRHPRTHGAPRVANDGSSLISPSWDPALTWVGHATFVVEEEHQILVTDPHWGQRALIHPRRTPPGIPLSAVPEESVVLLSHNHYDHLHLRTARLLSGARWLVPSGVGKWLSRHGFPRVEELDWWEHRTVGPWRLTALPSQHWSRRLSQGLNRSLWCAWLVESRQQRLFFGGDSGYFFGYRELGRLFGPLDTVILPVGAYEPRSFMRYQHMDPAEAVTAFEELGGRHLIPMHWGTFALAEEGLDEPPRALLAAADRQGLPRHRIRILAVGERWLPPPTLQSSGRTPGSRRDTARRLGDDGGRTTGGPPREEGR